MLELLFTSKNRIKILSYFLFNGEITTQRQLSRSLDIPISVVQKEVSKLKLLNLLNNSPHLQLNHACSFIGDLKNIFIKTDFLIEPLKKYFTQGDYILIFGSFAKGNFDDKSDLDILIIGSVFEDDAFKQAKKAESVLNREVNPVVWTKHELTKRKSSGFVQDIFNNEIILIKGDEKSLRKLIE